MPLSVVVLVAVVVDVVVVAVVTGPVILHLTQNAAVNRIPLSLYYNYLGSGFPLQAFLSLFLAFPCRVSALFCISVLCLISSFCFVLSRVGTRFLFDIC